jgi:hypothetical protein
MYIEILKAMQQQSFAENTADIKCPSEHLLHAHLKTRAAISSLLTTNQIQ